VGAAARHIVRFNLARLSAVAREVGWAGRPAWEVLLGFALLVPAAIFLLGSQLGPALWMVRAGLRHLPVTPVGVGESGPAGAARSGYAVAVDDGFFDAVGFALSMAGLPLLAAVVVAPTIAWFAHRGGTPGRVMALVGLALPSAAFAPAAVAAAWRTDRGTGLAGAGATGTVRAAYGLTVFGLTCAIAVLFHLAALRRPDRGDVGVPAGPAALGVAATLAGCTALAAALQEFTFPFVLTGGGPGRATTTPLLAVFTGLHPGEVAPAAAASAMLLGLLAVPGIGVTALIVRTGARLDLDACLRSGDDRRGWDPPRVLAAMATKVLVTAVLVITGYALWPWLMALHAGAAPPPGSASTGALFVNTWLPPLLSTLIGVGAAAAAGYGIGALRPLGRRSELLLLPFAPFLFVGVGPLALPAYVGGVTADHFDTVLGLLPPTRLAVPALFVFTLLARGQALRVELARRDGERLPWTAAHLRPAWPMIGLGGLASWVGRRACSGRCCPARGRWPPVRCGCTT
jgi:ABC-type sugar transport system permease subunit